MKDSMQCPFCAEDIKKDAKKCRYCGEWLEKESESSSRNSKIPNQYNQRSVALAFLIWLITLILFLVLVHIAEGDFSDDKNEIVFLFLLNILVGSLTYIFLLVRLIQAIVSKHWKKAIIPFFLTVSITGCFLYFIFYSESESLIIEAQPRNIDQSYDMNDEKIFSFVNDKRISEGLKPLVFDEKLFDSALKKAEDMCEKQYWAHNGPNGEEPWQFITNSGFEYDKAGENIARDFYSEILLVDSWMNSPSHKENIVSDFYTHSAVASKTCMLSGVNTDVVVQHFANFPSKRRSSSTIQQSDPNEPVHCPVYESCGGGTVPLLRWECEQSTCCGMRDGSWKFYTSTKQCNEDQARGL